MRGREADEGVAVVWFEEPMNIWTTERMVHEGTARSSSKRSSACLRPASQIASRCFASLAMAYDFSLDDLDYPITSLKSLRYELFRLRLQSSYLRHIQLGREFLGLSRRVFGECPTRLRVLLCASHLSVYRHICGKPYPLGPGRPCSGYGDFGMVVSSRTNGKIYQDRAITREIFLYSGA